MKGALTDLAETNLFLREKKNVFTILELFRIMFVSRAPILSCFDRTILMFQFSFSNSFLFAKKKEIHIHTFELFSLHVFPYKSKGEY